MVLTMVGSGRILIYSAILLKPEVIAQRMQRKYVSIFHNKFCCF